MSWVADVVENFATVLSVSYRTAVDFYQGIKRLTQKKIIQNPVLVTSTYQFLINEWIPTYISWQR